MSGLRLSDRAWRTRLDAEQYRILRGHGTERPGSSALLHERRRGTYCCAGCGRPLFRSAAKFDSSCGWPSFTAPLDGALATSADSSNGMLRTEVHCANCESHMGHVFPDGPPPDGLRYCINGAALVFEAAAPTP